MYSTSGKVCPMIRLIEHLIRWVLVTPQGDGSCALLLANADEETQESRIVHQTGGEGQLSPEEKFKIKGF